MMQLKKKEMRLIQSFTSRLPPFPFAFEPADAFVQSSNQTSNRLRFRRPTGDAAVKSSTWGPRQRASANCWSDFVGAAAFVGFGV